MNCLDVNLDQFGHEHGHGQHDYMRSASHRSATQEWAQRNITRTKERIMETCLVRQQNRVTHLRLGLRFIILALLVNLFNFGRELTRLLAALSLPKPSTLNVTAKRLCMFAHVCVRTVLLSIHLSICGRHTIAKR